MGCVVIRDEDGAWAGFACSRGGRRPKRCTEPGCTRDGGRLCDFPLARGGTCSRPVCASHGQHLAPDTDWCGGHVRWWAGVAGLLAIGIFARR